LIRIRKWLKVSISTDITRFTIAIHPVSIFDRLGYIAQQKLIGIKSSPSQSTLKRRDSDSDSEVETFNFPFALISIVASVSIRCGGGYGLGGCGLVGFQTILIS
jgi:hypothetical protein